MTRDNARMNLRSLEKLEINHDWANLPLFDRSKWQKVRFGDVVENLNETCNPVEDGIERFIGLEHLEPGSLNLRNWGNVVDGTTFTRRVRPGQVLFGKRRAYQRKIALASFDAVVSGDIYVFATKSNRLLPELLPLLCASDRFCEYAVGTSAGSLSPRTNWRSLGDFKFDLPPPNIQQRIAEVFDRTFAVESAYGSVQTESSRAKEAFVRELASSPRARVRLESVARRITSGSRGWAAHYASAGAAFVRITNLRRADVRLDWNDTQFVQPPDGKEAERTKVLENDLLVSVTAELGLVAVAEQLPFDDVYVNQHIAKITLDPNRYDAYLAAVFLSLLPFSDQFRRMNDQGAKAGMNLKNVGKLELPDISISAQKTFASRLRTFDRAAVAVELLRERSANLRAVLFRIIC